MIADRIFDLVCRAAADGEPIARKWRRVLGNKAPRSLAKPIVMTTPYGVSDRRIMQFAGEALDELDPKCRIFPGDERQQAQAWMAKIMKRALSGRLGSSQRIMRWLKDMAAVASKAPRSGGLDWTTPTGWPWVMSYGMREPKRVEVKFHGDGGNVQRGTAVMQVESEARLSKREQRTAISSNFIHALDASALVFTLNLLESRAVSGVAVIHDCVGGLATEMGGISQAVRDGFVKLYTEHDPLRSLHNSVSASIPAKQRNALPEPPELGTFDVREVLESRYFFA